MNSSMKPRLTGATLAALFLAPATATAQDLSSQIVGVWKLQRFDRCVVGGACVPFYGEKPTGHNVFTKTGLFLSQGYGTGRVVSKTPDPTDAERVELFKSMYAWGGPYKIEGNKVTTSIEFAWTEAWRGQPRSATFKVEGKLLTLESSQFKSTIDGATIFTKLLLERIE